MRNPEIVNMRFGSHLYQLNTPDSDVDYKGIYLPTHRELILGQYAKSYKSSTGGEHTKNQAGDIDTEVISLPQFIKFAVAGETLALDMLHCNEPLITSSIWENLVSLRTLFYSKNLKAFVGYVQRQAAKYGVKGSRLFDMRSASESIKPTSDKQKLSELWDDLYVGEYAEKVVKPGPNDTEVNFYQVAGKLYSETMKADQVYTAIATAWMKYGERAELAAKNQGIDWKAVSHALRAAYQARDIFLYGDFQYPLAETEFLLSVKQGRLDYKTEVGPQLESVVDQVNSLSEVSTLPVKCDANFWDDWLIDVYEHAFNLEFIL